VVGLARRPILVDIVLLVASSGGTAVADPFEVELIVLKRLLV